MKQFEIMDPNTQQSQQPVVSQQIQQPELHQEASNSSFLLKATIIIIGIIIILGVSGGSYYLGTKKMNKSTAITTTNISPTIVSIFSPTHQTMPTQADQDTNWQTYTNAAFGVTFSYPKDYVTVQEQANQIRLIRGLGYIFEIKKLPIPDTVNSWWQKGAQLDTNGSQLNTKDYLELTQPWNNYQAYLFKLNSNNYQVPMNFYAIRVDNANYTSSAIYTISYETDFPLPDPAYQQANINFDKTEKPIITKILDSFHFTDPHFSMSDY